MTQPPVTSTSICERTWIEASAMVQPQEALDYFSQQDCILSSTEMPSLDGSSGDEQSVMPQVSSPNNYSSSPSPVSFPPSPLVTTDSQQCSLPLAYISLGATSSPPNVASISINGPYPNPLLDNSVLGDLGLDGPRYQLSTHSFYQAGTTDPSRVQSTRPLSLHEYDGHIQGAGQWSDTVMQTPRGHDPAHPHSHHFESRSLSHWHPYNRQQSTALHNPGPFESYGARQLSAPSSPAMSPSMSTVESPSWVPLSQHRRTASAGHPQSDEFDRRFSEGDLIDNLLPDFSMSLSFFSAESASSASSASTTSSPQTGRQRSFSSSLHDHHECIAVCPNSPTSGTADSSSASSMVASSGSNTPGVYKCEYEGCTKSFSRPYNLNSHIRTHTNLRPYHCDHCDRQFARLHDKNRHERLHRGVRPFACERCQHHFARMDALNRHLKVEGGRNLCNLYLIEKNSPSAMPIVDLPPKKINPLILAHFPNFGKPSSDDDASVE